MGSAYISGNLGVGILDPQAKLDVNGAFKALSITTNSLNTQSANIDGYLNAKSIIINHIATGVDEYANRIMVNKDVTMALAVTRSNFGNNTFIVYGSGHVYAQSASFQGFLLAQTATLSEMLCTPEVRITNTACWHWPDFVFEKDYKLLSLNEVEQYIVKNQHLPNMPSAAEVEANGVNLGEMNALLLQKVEELTLYIIQLEKRLTGLGNKKGEE
jgi:hypothetical protein